MTVFKGGDAIRAFLEEFDSWLSPLVEYQKISSRPISERFNSAALIGSQVTNSALNVEVGS
ncbi:hypothetical protein HLRTI_003260, partial [Halorhabdus tiamatea SARL4B]